jgi:hypothetical protein
MRYKVTMKNTEGMPVNEITVDADYVEIGELFLSFYLGATVAHLISMANLISMQAIADSPGVK